MTPLDVNQALSVLDSQTGELLPSTAFDSGKGESTHLRLPQVSAHEHKLIDGVRSAFAQASVLPDLNLYLKTKQGTLLFLKHGTAVPLNLNPIVEGAYETFVTSSSEPAELLIQCTGPLLVQSLARLVIKHANELVEAGEREEVLMEEIAADWESLDALCEINTEVFTSTTLSEGTNRLIRRIASLKEGFHGALFLQSGTKLECVVSTGGEGPPSISVQDLGPVRRVLDERGTIVMNRIDPAVFGGRTELCWHAARSLAAVPMLTPEAIRGFVIVWSELEKGEIDTSFQHLIDALSNRVSMLLECESLTNAARQTELSEQELEIASTIQDTLLGGDVPHGVAGMDFAALSIPSRRIGGDFFDFYQQRNGSVDLLIGDVMGKGVAAALLGTAVKNQFTKALLAQASSPDGELMRPEHIVQQVSKSSNARLIEVERFVTLCYARVNPQNHVMEYVDCGHTNTIVHRKQCGQSFVLQGDSLPLGIDPADKPMQQAVEFLPGDTFLFYSDGVTENADSSGELFGTERLIECVEQWSSCGPQILLDRLCRISKLHCSKPFFSDDFTAVAVRIGLCQTTTLHRLEAEFARDLHALGAVREWLAEAAALVGDHGLAEDALFRLQLISVEAFDNCVIHGSSTAPACPIKLEALVFQNSIRITIRQEAPAFDPFSAPAPSFDGSRDGGFGLYIMLRSADEFQYRREADSINVISFSVTQPIEGKHFHATNHYKCE